MLWIPVKSKAPDTESSNVPFPRLRRSLGQESFPNVQLFRTCLPWEGEDYKVYSNICTIFIFLNSVQSKVTNLQQLQWTPLTAMAR